MPPELAEEITDNAALGGRLRLLQPRRGHRFGHDAILLAAATPAQPGDRVVDLGAGVGAAGLAVAARVAGIRLTLVEIDQTLAALAARNVERNGFSRTANAVTLDVAACANEFDRVGLAAGSADRVIMNPPFHDIAQANPSADARRRTAYLGGRDLLRGWLATAERLLRPDGTLTLIYRADERDDVLALLAAGYGDVAVLPVFPKPDAPAIRVLVNATKGSRAPHRELPGLWLNDGAGKPDPRAEDILRRGTALC